MTLYGDQSVSSDKDASVIVLAITSASAHDDEAQNYLQNLTRLANEAANSIACGSFLAGRGSETDEFGDVSISFGDVAVHPQLGGSSEVLRLLDLDNLLQGAAKVNRVYLLELA